MPPALSIRGTGRPCNRNAESLGDDGTVTAAPSGFTPPDSPPNWSSATPSGSGDGDDGDDGADDEHRADDEAELDALRRRIRATGELAGAEVDVRPAR